MKYRPEIDGLRTVAVVPVVFYHAGFPAFAGGFVGVDVFFVISGFLITRIIADEVATGRFSIVTFYDRRIRRIMPALFFVMLCCTPFAWLWMSPAQMALFGQSAAAITLFASNVLFWRTTDYFAPAADENPLLHTWSLAVEEQYYVIFPIVLLVLWRFGLRAVTVALCLAALASFALSEFGSLLHPGFGGAFNYFMLPTRAWQLLVGALLALWAPALRPASAGVRDTLTALGLLMIVIAVFAYDHDTPFPGAYALPPTLGAALAVLCADRDGVVGRLLAAPAMVGLGLISYSLYLWHQPLFAFARIRVPGEPSTLLLLALCVVSVGLAWFSWRFVEQPFRNKDRIGRKALFSGAVTVSVATAGAGVLAWGTGGLPQRLDPAVRAQLAAIEISPVRDRCMTAMRNPIGVDQACVYPTAAEAPSWAVMGNSHSVEFAYALGEALEARGESLLHLAVAGCAPQIGYDDRQGFPYCRAWHSDALRTLVRTPTVRNVVLVYRFWTDYERIVGGATEAEKRALYHRGFESIVTGLQEAGKTVWVMLPIPELRDHIAKTLLRQSGAADAPDRPLALHEATYRDVIAWLRSLPDVRLIDPAPVFCDAAQCYAARDGAALFFDDDHPSMAAARRLAARLLVQRDD